MTLKIIAKTDARSAEILTPKALDLVEQLELKFGERRRALMADRQARQKLLDAGGLLDFLPETKAIREGDWKVTSIPADIIDRRVEITGPVDRKMIINALNSGAKVFMADLEDAHSPTWEATIDGQINLRDYFANQISFTSPEGKDYEVGDNPAVLMVRVRGLHMEEKNVLLNDKRISGCLFDFGVFLANCHELAKKNNKGLYFYIPKMEHYLEARLWNDIFAFTEEALGIPHGTLRCTALIETIPAAFQMEEILYEMKDYMIALNAGRWDYIFSFIKRFKKHGDKALPDRAQITMNTHFLRSYSQLLIQICHKRGAHAMGGMAAQIPIKNDPKANAEAGEKVRNDKLREVKDGHDGTWVAHPGLVSIAMDVFNEYMPEPNQIAKPRPLLDITAKDLLQMPEGTITPEGIWLNVSATLQYIMAWLQGQGAVPIFNLMEDAATAEISRTQLWQWVHLAEVKSTDGEVVTLPRIRALIDAEVVSLKKDLSLPLQEKLQQASEILWRLVESKDCEEFITTPAYELI